MIKRRELIIALGAGVALPLAVRAQQSAMTLVGLLSGTQLEDRMMAPVRQGLKEAGFVEGKNVAIEHRSADGHFDRLPALARELVAGSVAVIIARGPGAAVAAKAATATIPVVFTVGTDPVDLGLVSSLNRPGGNVTGVTFLTTALGVKRLELLRTLVPNAAKTGFLVNPQNPTSHSQIGDIETAARTFGVDLVIVNAASESDLEAAFASLVQQRINAIIIGGDQFFLSRRDQLTALAARNAMPAIYYLREYVAAGGLASYGTNVSDSFRQAGIYAGRILKGERPGDLPVMLPTKFEIVINLKTAKVLGLAIPDKLLATADEVIE